MFDSRITAQPLSVDQLSGIAFQVSVLYDGVQRHIWKQGGNLAEEFFVKLEVLQNAIQGVLYVPGESSASSMQVEQAAKDLRKSLLLQLDLSIGAFFSACKAHADIVPKESKSLDVDAIYAVVTQTRDLLFLQLVLAQQGLDGFRLTSQERHYVIQGLEALKTPA